jgi:hypothetical protein
MFASFLFLDRVKFWEREEKVKQSISEYNVCDFKTTLLFFSFADIFRHSSRTDPYERLLK